MTKIKRDGAFWGVLLITVGGLFILSTLGLLKISIWNLVFPVFLVFWGLWVLIRIFTNPRTYSSEGGALNIPLDGAERARVRLNQRMGRLHVSRVAPADQLVDGTIGVDVDYDVHRYGATLDVELRGTRDMWPRMFNPQNWYGCDRRNMWPRMCAPWSWREPQVWDITLNGDIPLELSVESGFNKTRLDLSELLVTDLKLHTSMSETEVTLPAKARRSHAKIRDTMSDVKVYVPEGVAARIHATSGWADVSVNEGRFPRSGDVYQSPDYDISEHKVEIDAKSDMGALKII